MEKITKLRLTKVEKQIYADIIKAILYDMAQRGAIPFRELLAKYY